MVICVNSNVHNLRRVMTLPMTATYCPMSSLFMPYTVHIFYTRVWTGCMSCHKDQQWGYFIISPAPAT